MHWGEKDTVEIKTQHVNEKYVGNNRKPDTWLSDSLADYGRDELYPNYFQ